MKKNLFMTFALVALVMMSCKENSNINAPGDNGYNYDSIPVLVPDTDGIEISVDSAIAICKALGANQVTAERYKLSGVLTANSTSPDDVPSKYTNINFKLSDNGNKTSISCYYINNINNVKFRKGTDVPLVGSKLTVLGSLTNYKGTTPELKDGFIVRIDSMVRPIPAETIQATCAEAKTAALALPAEGTSNDIYIIDGYVQSAGYDATISKGQQKWFWVDDVLNGQKTFEAYWCNVPDGVTPVPVGAKVRLTGKIMNYNGTVAEMKNGKITILEEPAAGGE